MPLIHTNDLEKLVAQHDALVLKIEVEIERILVEYAREDAEFKLLFGRDDESI